MTHRDRWLSDWLTAPLSALEVETNLDIEALRTAIAAYRRWHDRDGLVALQKRALSLCLDADQAMEAVTETYLDVRQRMAGCVSRAASGRTVPRFVTPSGVARYHEIQVRLRLQHRWSRRRSMVSIDDVTLSTPPTAERSTILQHSALPLRFAACWTLADLPRRAAEKDEDWWWQMLRHGLKLDRVSDLSGARNDPTEAVDRLRVRMAFARGARRLIKQWAEDRPGWQDLSVSLPRTRPEHAAVAAVLPSLKASIAPAIADLDCTPQEALGLHRLLVRGATARTNLARFSGSDRRARAASLAEQLGASVCVVDRRHLAVL